MILHDLRLIYYDLNIGYNIDIGYNIGYNTDIDIDIDYNIDIDIRHRALRDGVSG